MRTLSIDERTSRERLRSATRVRIVDVINLAASAKEMLLDRALRLHRPPDVENWIVCAPPDPADLRGDGARHVEMLRRSGVPLALVKTPLRLRPGGLARYLLDLVGLFRRVRPH